MQIKIVTIPIYGGESLTDEMNVFLRSKKILQMESKLVSEVSGSAWCFCIRYMDDLAISERTRERIDYRKELDEPTFKKFAALREIRKKVAEAESVPAYVIFTDEELAQLAKLEQISPDTMKTIKGIGDKKVRSKMSKENASALSLCQARRYQDIEKKSTFTS